MKKLYSQGDAGKVLGVDRKAINSVVALYSIPFDCIAAGARLYSVEKLPLIAECLRKHRPLRGQKVDYSHVRVPVIRDGELIAG